MAEIADLIKKMTKTQEEIYSCVCTVVEIDEAKRLISVKPNKGDADVFDVRLQASVSANFGAVFFPKMNSEVIITFLSKELAYVSLFAEIEKIQLNIGDFSLFVDASNMNLAVENIDVTATNTEVSSDNIKVNASDTEINSDNVTINSQTTKVVTTNFEVQGANIKLSAPLVDIMAGAVNIAGAVAITGAVSIAGAVAINGGANGGVPLGGALVTELNKVKTDFANLKAKFSAWSPVANDGGTALKAQLNGWTPQTTPVTAAAISNPQITQ